MIEVRLEPYEIEAGAIVAVRRRVESIRQGRQHVARWDGQDPWRMEVEGVLAEVVVAKVMGRYWPPSWNTFHASADIPPRVEVRWTGKPAGGLLVRDRDPIDRTYVLVTGDAPIYQVVGWMRGADAKVPAYRWDANGRPPCYLVPRADLRPWPEATAP